MAYRHARSGVEMTPEDRAEYLQDELIRLKQAAALVTGSPITPLPPVDVLVKRLMDHARERDALSQSLIILREKMRNDAKALTEALEILAEKQRKEKTC
jgi:hypothetical protein